MAITTRRGRPARNYVSKLYGEIDGLTKLDDGRWKIRASKYRFSEQDEGKAVRRFYELTGQSVPIEVGVNVEGTNPGHSNFTAMNQFVASLQKPGVAPDATFSASNGARLTDVIDVSVGTIAPGVDHPAMFPLPLADRLIRTFSPVDGLVVDPTCGSGTTLEAARDAGRRSWGCDIVPRYAALARQRLAVPLSQ